MESAGCEAVPQSTMTQEAGRRTDFHFVCPSGREFLHDWDAALDDEVSIHLVRQEAEGLTVRVRNAAATSRSFTLTLGCSDRVYEGEPGHKTMILRSPGPPGR